MCHVAIYGSNGLLGEGLKRLLGESGHHVLDRSNGKDAPSDSADLVLIENPSLVSPLPLLKLLARAITLHPSARMLVLSERGADMEILRSALANGARGWVEISCSLAAMLSAIDAVLHDQVVCPCAPGDRLPLPAAGEVKGAAERMARADPGAMSTGELVVRAAPRAAAPAVQADEGPSVVGTKAELREAGVRLADVSLSDRETEILQLLTQGDANKVIARRLNISEATVKSHLKSLLRKLNFTNRTQAAIWAVNRGKTGAHDGQRSWATRNRHPTSLAV